MRQGDYRCMVCNPPLVMSLNSFVFCLAFSFFVEAAAFVAGFGFGVYQFFSFHSITFFNLYAPLL